MLGAMSPPALAGQAADEEQPPAPAPPRPPASPPRWLPQDTTLPDPRYQAIYSPRVSRYTAIYYLLGLGAPVGFIGLEAVHHFRSLPFELAAGFGNGFSAARSSKSPPFGHAIQWSVMPRVRAGDESNAFTLGAGISGGNYGNSPTFAADGQPPDTYPTKYVLWLNLEIGGEHWSTQGFAVRYFLGWANGCTFVGCSRTVNNGTLSFPYLGIGLGYAW
jgi:hypothetical protein